MLKIRYCGLEIPETQLLKIMMKLMCLCESMDDKYQTASDYDLETEHDISVANSIDPHNRALEHRKIYNRRRDPAICCTYISTEHV